MRARASAVACLAALCVVAYALVALAAPTFPPLTGRVVDDANIIPPDVRTAIDGKLATLEAQTTDQFVVVTLPSLQGYDIADYGYQLGRHWGIGQKGKDNGVLLIVAPNEREVRIEVGYGLEGDLTDAVSNVIIENAIIPRFRAGDMPGGIQAGVDDIIKVLTGGAGAFKERAAEQAQDDDNPLLPIAVFLAIWVTIILLTHLRRRKGRWIWAAGPAAGAGWSSGGWYGGGSFGGGSFGGGFSGGGGSFGGGGSSGRW